MQLGDGNCKPTEANLCSLIRPRTISGHAIEHGSQSAIKGCSPIQIQYITFVLAFQARSACEPCKPIQRDAYRYQSSALSSRQFLDNHKRNAVHLDEPCHLSKRSKAPSPVEPVSPTTRDCPLFPSMAAQCGCPGVLRRSDTAATVARSCAAAAKFDTPTP